MSNPFRYAGYTGSAHVTANPVAAFVDHLANDSAHTTSNAVTVFQVQLMCLPSHTYVMQDAGSEQVTNDSVAAFNKHEPLSCTRPSSRSRPLQCVLACVHV